MNKEIELKPCREAFEKWLEQDCLNDAASEDYWQGAERGFQAGYAQLQAEIVRLREALEKIVDKAEKCGAISANNFVIEIGKAALQHNEETK
jgi:hypothetical protein